MNKELSVQSPEAQALASVYLLCRGTLAFVWLWHGLVPKLLFPTTGEVEVTVASGMPPAWATTINTAAGIGECLFALALVAFWRTRWLLAIQIPLLVALLLPLAVREPALFTRPFQPLTLNVPMVALALCGLLVSKGGLPGARRE